MTYHKSLICPVCCGNEFSKNREVFDDRYGQPNLFTLMSCNRCHHMMTTPMLSEDELPNLYGTYYPRKKLSADSVAIEAKKVNLSFSKFRRWWMGTDNQGQYSVHTGEKILDVGCGSGLSLLEAQELGAEAWGIEADPNVKPIAATLGLRIHQGNLKDMPFSRVKFDLVVLNQVIEHIPEPDRALQIIHKLLAKNGRVIMVFPNIKSFWCKLSGARWINWHIPYHLHHFSKKTFTQMVERCGYQVVSSRTITPNIWTILQLRAFKGTIVRGEANHVWKVNENMSSKKINISLIASLRNILFISIMAGIAVVNRIVDVVGLGDSLIVELRSKDTM